jgi:hypothetical protein
MTSEDPYDRRKRKLMDALQGGVDHSPKGHIDAPVVDFM